jgi:hypothetical protein
MALTMATLTASSSLNSQKVNGADKAAIRDL